MYNQQHQECCNCQTIYNDNDLQIYTSNEEFALFNLKEYLFE